MMSFKSYLVEKQQCDFITFNQLKAIESKLDQAFKRYKIDWGFTKHFADRMSDERNDPCISVKELGLVFTKIYKNQGKKVKGSKNFEAVIKDFSSDLNIPIAVKYDARNDEFDVSLKTIMRKKNFKTPDKILGYK